MVSEVKDILTTGSQVQAMGQEIALPNNFPLTYCYEIYFLCI